ncbi:5'-methylthioadenosine/adenosylhomocysteine nucleosidase [Parasynechococcus sp.]|jgi:adenosylhomocysteine nucleosidase|uniref:5'-methylthioadenosine/adenosylhomocysteine nucleosidase n=1 Tax=Parasynechococcus sp. TaxID=3101203 RepID=UPI003703CAD8
MTRPLHIGLLSAMPEEIGSDLTHLEAVDQHSHGDFTLHRCRWHGPERSEPIQLSLAWSGWGKVCAARAATRLLASASADAPLDLLLFTGVAGAADPALKQWDVVLASGVIQHDMDASPLFPRFTLPPLNRDRLQPEASWLSWARQALEDAHRDGSLTGFGAPRPGLIGTGDQFISSATVLDQLRRDLPDLQAVEMEGAAVAQVAEQEGIPWLVLRVISDSADGEAADSFTDFVRRYDHNAWRLVEALLKRQGTAPRR